MAKKWIGLSMLLMLVQLLSAQTIIQPTDDEKLIMDRFEYIRLVKNYTGDVFWSKFSTRIFRVPLSISRKTHLTLFTPSRR
ncbi:MAG TPA: hypothetical protein PLU78_08775 [Chitinophagales bacterium]|nr:hypothetical protein [Chitinophagales bacterium]